MQRRCGGYGKAGRGKGGERLSLYLLEISLVLAFIAAACIPARCAYATVYRQTYTTRDMFRGIFTARCPAQREHDEAPLRFLLYERRGNTTRGSTRIVKERVSGLEISESSDDFALIRVIGR